MQLATNSISRQLIAMKYLKLLVIFLFSSPMIWAQYDFVAPLSVNPDLIGQKKQDLFFAKNGNSTFDSTFIYKTDTLVVSLTRSFLDEFTKNRFQQYVPDFTGPDVTFERYYKLLKKDGVTVLPADTKYSNTPTYRKKINTATNIIVNEVLPTDTIKVADFSSYPPVYTTTVVYPAYNIYDTINFPNEPDTLMMVDPFFKQDSATQFFNIISDPEAYWLDDNAYHNYRFAKDPWTLGVVTFDGLDRNGYPYNNFTSPTARGIADILTSKPIDMSALNAGNEVYLSFLYQTEGFGDVPESNDSLILEFYSPVVDQWFRIWSAQGEPVSDFKKVHLKIDDNKYFQKGFQMRFKNYGSLAGSLDHFHLDYVHLRASSGPTDTAFKDFAFVYPVGSFLKDYTSVPWDHYKNNPTGKMNNKTKFTVRNGSQIAENSQDGNVWIQYAGTTEGNFVLSDYELTGHDPATNYAPLATIVSYHDFSNGYRFDENKPGDSQVFDLFATATVQYSQLTINDSTSGKQVFSNYYAYDDGSAEQAYGVTGAQSMLAYKFTPYENDSLIGVKMHFVPTVQNVSNHLFLLTVWDDNNGKPGNKIYEDEFFFPRSPKYESAQNKFTDYYLKDTMKLRINGSFYVGWRQMEGDKLCIGLDRNINNQDKIFYSVNNGNTWINSAYEGSLMIRPIFSTAMDATLGIEKIDRPSEMVFDLYPNPFHDLIKINTNNVDFRGVMVVDLQGKIILQTNSEEKEINLSHLNSGIYLVRDITTGATKKIVKY